MLAWHLDAEHSDHRFGEVPDPVPGPGDVRLSVVTSALNHMDHWLTVGRPRPPSFPHVPGCDVAGIVESLGPGVTSWAVGDEVVVNAAVVPEAALSRGVDSVLDPGLQILGEHRWGGHGALCVVPAHQLARRPKGRTWVEAATYPVCSTTAWRMLRRGRLEAGERVLVTGIGGGFATAAFCLARHLGAEVHVTSRDPAKRRRALELGAAGAHDSSEPLPVQVDVVVESIGPAVWDHVVGALRPGGRLLVCGGTSGPTVELDLPRLFYKQLEIIGASCGSQEEFSDVTRFLEEGLEVVVDGVYPLERYPEALQRLRAGEQVGKLVLEHTKGGTPA